MTGTDAVNAGNEAGTEAILGPTRSQTPEGVVYFVRVGDHPFVKIGRTTKLGHRMITLQTAHWEPIWLALVMPGSGPLEHELHARFADERHTGEWFRLSERIERFIRACEPEHEILRGRYAWHGPMTGERFAAIYAKLNPNTPALTDSGLWSVNR